jgi:hypothetical protein
MPVGHKDPCPCGSGKKYKHCHMKKDLEKHQHGGWILVGTVVVLGVAVIYFANSGGLPWGGDRVRTPASSSLPFTPGTLPMTGLTPATDTAAAGSVASQDQSPLPGGVTPQPWQYDAPRNRFWYPEHGHWHDGPPPDPSQRVTTPATATTGAAAATSGASRDQSPLPGGATPQPWQYDAPRNRFWYPDHGHWHDGPPPDASQRVTTVTTPASSGASQDQSPLPGGATPQPWQYDGPRNRFWHPDHGHWHIGPPPDPSQRAAATATQTTTPAVDQSPLPGGITPTPNYYDEAKNRYWVAEHSHWHSGRPPAATGTTGTTTATPATPAAPTPQPAPAQPEPTPEPTPAP